MRVRIIMLLSLMYMHQLYAQESAYFFQVMVKDGLADRLVIDVSSDPTGVYYIHTPSAVQTYVDGHIEHTISLPSSDQATAVASLGNFFLRVAPDDYLYVISRSPLSIVDSIHIGDLTDGALYLVTSDVDSYQLLTRDGDRYVAYDIVMADAQPIVRLSKTISHKGDIQSFLIDGDDVYYIDDTNKLYRNEVEIHDGRRKQDFSRNVLAQIHKGTDGGIYFSYINYEGIYRLKDYSISFFYDKGFIGTYDIDDLGNTLIGVTSHEYLSLDEVLFVQNGVLVNTISELLNDRITAFYSEDFRRHVLTATHNGIYYYKNTPVGIWAELQDRSLVEGDFGYVIRRFVSGHDDYLRVLPEDGGGVFRVVGRSITLDPHLSYPPKPGRIWMNYEEGSDTYWIGRYIHSQHSELTQYDQTGRVLDHYDLPMTIELAHVDTRYLYVFGRVGADGQLLRIDRHDGSRVYLISEALSNVDIRSVAIEDDIFFIGTREGVIRYDVTRDIVDRSLLDKTRDTHVSHVKMIADHLYVGTYGRGLYVYDEDHQLVSHHDLGMSTPSNTVASIERDANGLLWISTFDGICVIDSTGEMIDRLDREDGIRDNEFNRASSYVTKDGELLFGNLNGYLRIDPSRYMENRASVLPLIRNLKVMRASGDVYTQQNVKSNVLSIKGRVEQLELEFFRPSFDGEGESTDLAYRDVEISGRYNSMTISDDVILLTGLAFGQYEVQVVDRYSDTRQSIARITISRDYDEIRRGISIGLLVGLSSLALALLYVRHIRKRNAEQMALNNELNNMKMKALRSQLNPHFIFNSLNSIQYYIQINEKRLARDYLSKFARLMRLILESTYEDRVSLKHEIDQVSLYLELEKMRFEDKWDYELSVDHEINLETTHIPSMMLQPIIENAILHGLGNLKERRGKLDVQIRDAEKYIQVIIDDNGVGRQRSAQINALKNKSHRSLSSQITQDRMSIMNTNKADIDISYTDKYDGEIPMGTTVRLQVLKDNYIG